MMALVIQGFGIVLVVMGVVYLLKPGISKQIAGFFKKGKLIYLAGLIRLAMAVVFLLGARECDISWVIIVFGVLFLVSGIVTFMLGSQKAGTIIDWYQRQSNILIRVIAIIILAAGAVIIHSA